MRLSPQDLLCRLDQFDITLTDEECRAAVAALGDDVPASLDQASSAVRSIMRVHPRTDVDDAEAYALAAAAILSEYPADVLIRVSDPRTGIVRRVKFLPRLAELAEACDAEISRRHRMRCNAAAITWQRTRQDAKDYNALKEARAKFGLS
jgi:hypothetical protein